MKGHPVFDQFAPVERTATGAHLFDFLGVSTSTRYNRAMKPSGRAPGEPFRPGVPSRNEHYFDWIAILTAVSRARGTFRMAELGAGWGPWTVRAATAARRRPEIAATQLVAVEADPSHYDWMHEHFAENGVDPHDPHHHLMFGAVAARPGTMRFPRLAEPDVVYGGAARETGDDASTIEVPAVTLDTVLGFFDGPLDLMHVDIQSAEYEVLPPWLDRLQDRVKMIMVGTHISLEKHEGLEAAFRAAGWRMVYAFPRHGTVATDFGEIRFDDGFLLAESPRLIP